MGPDDLARDEDHALVAPRLAGRRSGQVSKPAGAGPLLRRAGAAHEQRGRCLGTATGDQVASGRLELRGCRLDHEGLGAGRAPLDGDGTRAGPGAAQRHAGESGARRGGRDAREDLDLHAGPLEEGGLGMGLGVEVPAFHEAYDGLVRGGRAGEPVGDVRRADVRRHRDPLCGGRDPLEQPRVQPGGKGDGVCPLEPLCAAQRQQAGVPRADGQEADPPIPAYASVVISATPPGGGPAGARFGNSALRSGGAMNVVTMTINVSALNSPASSTPDVNPICAKISPTSPRGTMPTPITDFFPLNHTGA